MDGDIKTAQLSAFRRLFQSHDHIQFGDWVDADADEDFWLLLEGIAAHLRLVLAPLYRIDILAPALSEVADGAAAAAAGGGGVAVDPSNESDVEEGAGKRARKK
jgi:hypothetical protein